MIAKRVCSGRGIVGLTHYISHDAGSELLPQPTTSERVVWSAVYGMPACDLETAAKVMRGRFADAEILKRRAGASARGRKLRDPFDHLVLSWQRGTEPTGAAIARRCDAAVRALISKLGLEEHHVIAAVHVDKDHVDMHIATSRIHPETGLTTKRADTRRLQHLAAELDIAEGREPVPGVVRDLERGRTLAQSHRREQEAASAARDGRITRAEAEAVAEAEQQRRDTIAADKRAAHAARDQASPPPLRDTRAWRRGERQPRRPVWARGEWRDLRQRQRAELRQAVADDVREIKARHREERCALSRRMTAAAVAELDESGRRIAKRVENVRQAKWAPTPPAMSALTLVAETGTAAAAPHLSLGQRVADRVLPSRPSAWEAHLRRLTSMTLENEGVDLVMAFHSVMGPGAPGTRTRYRTLTTWATTTSIAGHPDADVNLLALRDVCKISDTTERRTALLAPPPDRSAAESDMAAEGTAVVGVGVEAARVDVDALVTDATLSGRGIETLGRATRTTVRGAAAVATIGGLVALAGTGMLAAGGLAVAGRVAVMADMRRRLRADPALGAAAALEGVSVRREIGSASPQYHSAPWSTDRVDEVARDLKRKVPYIDPMQPQPLPDSYRSQPRPGLLTRLGQMRWVIGSAPARPTPTHARQPASSQPTDRVDRGPAAPALPTPSPTESRPPPAPPQRPQSAMDVLRGLAVPKDTTRKGPSL